MRAMKLPADDATLAEALESANLPALLPAIVQLTGDLSLLQRFEPPSPGMMGAVDGNFSPEDQAAIRALSLEALGLRPIQVSTALYRDGVLLPE